MASNAFPPRLAVVLHLFYPELWPEFALALRHLPATTELTVTAPDGVLARVGPAIRGDFPEAMVVPVDNRGRDVAPFLTVLPRLLAEPPDLVLKLHGKKSGHREDGDAWRRDLLAKLLPPPAELSELLRTFATDAGLGMLAPWGHLLHSQVYLEANESRIEALAARMGMTLPKQGWRFAAGSMFWFRPRALAPLLRLNLRTEDFEEETGQVDGTLAHALERVFPLAVLAAGMKVEEGLAPAGAEVSGEYSFAERTVDGLKREVGRLYGEEQRLAAAHKATTRLALQRLEQIHALEDQLCERDQALKDTQMLALQRLEQMHALEGRLEEYDRALTETQTLALQRLEQQYVLEGRIEEYDRALTDTKTLALRRLEQMHTLEGRLQDYDQALDEARRLALLRLDQIHSLERRLSEYAEGLAEAQTLAFQRLDELRTLEERLQAAEKLAREWSEILAIPGVARLVNVWKRLRSR